MRINSQLKGMLLILIVLATIHPVWAKEAQPLAADPEQEKKVNDITKELRCLVCQNQTIADSHADLAIDLKNQVRQMVASGKTRKDVVDYMVKRYGDFVLYRPPMKPTTYLLWLGPFILLVVGAILLITNLRKRKKIITDAPLSTDESDRLQSLLSEKLGGNAATGKNSEGEVKPS